MRQALHIFRKDLRRGWPLLLLWAAALAVLSLPSWVDPLNADQIPANSRASLPFLLAVAATLVVALVIQHDSLVGWREFWMTRPIGAGPLMAAKALFIGLFVVLPPAALQFAASAHFGVPQHRWIGQFLDLGLPWAAFLVLAALLASATKGLAGFFSLFLALLIGPQLIVGILDQILGRESGSNTIPDGLVSSLGLAAAGLLVLQYLTRRRTLVALAGVVALPLAWMHPIAYRFDSGQQPNRNLGELRAIVSPEPGRESYAVVPPERGRSNHAALLRVRAEFLDASPEWSLQLSTREGKIEWRDGDASPAALRGGWFDSRSGPPVDGFAWADGRAPGPPDLHLWIQDSARFNRFLGRQGRFSGAGRATVLTRDVRSIELEPGAELARGDFAARVLDVRFEPPEIEIRVRIRKLTHAQGFQVAPVPILVNRSFGELAPLSASEEGRPVSTIPLLFSGSWPSAQDYIWSADLSGIAPSLADWVAGAEALVVFYDHAGYAQVAIEETEIVVDDESADPVDANEPGRVARQPLQVTVQQ